VSWKAAFRGTQATSETAAKTTKSFVMNAFDEGRGWWVRGGGGGLWVPGFGTLGFRVQPASVYGHPDNRVHTHRVQPVDLFLRCDAAGGCHFVARRGTDGLDGSEVRAAHQPFAIDVRVEEFVTVRLECVDGFHRGQRQRGFPSVNDDVA